MTMAINKLIIGTDVKFDLTNDTVSPDRLLKGVTAHDKSGKLITGTAKLAGDAPRAEYTVGDNGFATKLKLIDFIAIPFAFSYYPQPAAAVNLKEVDLSESPAIEEIGASAFYGCINAAFSPLPETVSIIRANAFYSCSSLALTKLPSHLVEISGNAFRGCASIQIQSLPDGLTKIGDDAFNGCKGITSLIIPSSVTSIGTRAFASCSALSSVAFKGTPSSIGNTAFNTCTKLMDIYVPWNEGEVAAAPWGATKATIHYGTMED